MPGDDLLQRGLDRLVGGDVGLAEPRGQVPTSTRLGTWRVISPGSATYDGHQGQAELGDQPEVGGVRVADDLAAS